MIGGRKHESFHVWPAFADLMSGVALVLLLVALQQHDQAVAAREDGQRIAQARDEANAHVRKLEADLAVERKKVGVQREIVERIQAALAGQGIKVSINKLWNLEIAADMLFASGRWEIPAWRRPDAEKVGAALITLLRDEQSSRQVSMLMVVGHTDQEGAADDNLDLSTKRARELVKLWQAPYLRRGEIAPGDRCAIAKIVAAGVGETRPQIADEAFERAVGGCGNLPGENTGCRRNRRIEIRVVLKDAQFAEIEGCT